MSCGLSQRPEFCRALHPAHPQVLCWARGCQLDQWTSAHTGTTGTGGIGLGIIVLGPNMAWSSCELSAKLTKSMLHTRALLATHSKHRLSLYHHRQRLLGQNNHLSMLLITTFLNLCGLTYHSWFPKGNLQLYPDFMCPKGHIYHVHATASKYPFYSCSDNAFGVENVNQITESPSPGPSLGSSCHHLLQKQRRFLLALWTGVRWMEKGLLPSMKLRSPYKEKSRTSLTKRVHASGSLFLYTDGTGNTSNLKKRSHFPANTKELF